MLPYTLIRSKRKTLTLEITREGELLARAPLRMPLAQVEAFLQEKEGWIRAKQGEIAARPRPPMRRYAEGERFFFLGEELALSYRQGLETPAREGKALLLPLARKAEAPQLVERWYRMQARTVLQERVAYYLPRIPGSSCTGLRITGAKTRWGSCGAKNNLNFPYHLVMAPLACVDSVVVHELCHTVRHDHSPAFWALVRRTLPDYEERHQILNNSRALFQLGERE